MQSFESLPYNVNPLGILMCNSRSTGAYWNAATYFDYFVCHPWAAFMMSNMYMDTHDSTGAYDWSYYMSCFIQDPLMLRRVLYLLMCPVFMSLLRLRCQTTGRTVDLFGILYL